jgi:hypothetical protein
MSPAFGLNVRTVMNLHVCNWSWDFTRSRRRERDKASVRCHPMARSTAGAQSTSGCERTPNGGYRPGITVVKAITTATWRPAAQFRPAPAALAGLGAPSRSQAAAAIFGFSRPAREDSVAAVPTRKNTRQRIQRRAQRYAPDMSFRGDQVTAPPDRRRPHPAGEQAYAAARGSLDDEPVGSGPAPSLPSTRNGLPGRTGPGLSQAGQARRASPGNVAPLGTARVPRPRRGNAPYPGTGRAPQPGDEHRGARPGHGPARAWGAPGRSRRDPARGYPPPPGDPGPRYPQPEFSAWNEPAAPATRAQGHLPYSAPTSADTGDAAAAASLGQGSGLALAERADGVLAGFSDNDLAAWAASLADAQAMASGEPSHPAGAGTIEREPERPRPDAGTLADAGTRSYAGSQTGSWPRTDVGPRHDASLPDVGSLHDARLRRDSAVSTTARAAGVTRAAAAKARKNARRRGRTRRRVVLAGVCLPAIAVLAAVAYARYPGSHPTASSPSSQGPSAASSASQSASTPGRWQHIATRTIDPSPLTLSQLFPAQFTVAGTGYTRTTQLASTHCSGAVFGAKLQAAVRRYKCSQVMRASYLAKGPKLMGTIGVLNLSNSTGAQGVGKVTGSSQFIAQLAAHSGPTHSLAKGTGLEEAEVKGHYLILTWVEFTTLRAPGTAHQKAELKAFSANLINRTANVSLTSRMVTGEPQVP